MKRLLLTFALAFGLVAPAWAAPSVTAGATSSDNSVDGTDHTVNLPACSAGRTLIVVLCTDGTPTVGYPAGWNIIRTLDHSSARSSIAWRKAVGDEGATMNVTTSASERTASKVFCVSDAEDPAVQPPQISTGATGSSANPDPDSVSPTGGSKDYLFIAGFGTNNASPTMDAIPANYGNGAYVAGGGGTSTCTSGTAYRAATASSEDPSAFTISSSQAWGAFTIAVHPGASATPRRRLILSELFDPSPLRWFLARAAHAATR